MLWIIPMENLTEKPNPLEEDPMSQRSRRGFLLSLIVPFTVSAAACSQPSPSQKVADQFMEAYYVRVSVKDASSYADGLAKEKLKGQLELLAGDGGPEPAKDIPRVTLNLIDKKNPSATEAIYVYEVRTHVQDVGKRMVFVKMRLEGGKWLVTQFTEDDAPPS